MSGIPVFRDPKSGQNYVSMKDLRMKLNDTNVSNEDTKAAINSIVPVSGETASPFSVVEGGFELNAN